MTRIFRECRRKVWQAFGASCLVCAVTIASHAGLGEDLQDSAASSARMSDDAAFDPGAACDDVVRRHNEIRAAAGQPLLAVSAKLQAAAERHAKDMAAREEMTHKGRDGSTPIERIKKTGYAYRRAGENVAVGRFTVDRLMKGWMNSPHHKKNILGSYSQIGVAYATGQSGKRYWCVTFGLPIRR